jgi:hypothetical protein
VRMNLSSRLLWLMIALCAAVGAHAQDNVYPTYGVHNPPDVSPCSANDCVYTRSPGEPTDPTYPPYWTSNWTMYRVFNHYAQYSPPYADKPPSPLRPGKDYEVSHGTTYYDSTWSGPTGQGAMMEHYEKRCLPIFPIANTFTCSFISLGDVAFFVTYDDRPKNMPQYCLFSPKNHPPALDFIKHLPYALGDSTRLGGTVQGYSFWISGDNGKPVQTGASPDRTADRDILFGYAFESTPRPDRADPRVPPYRRPQSFYFSGYPLSPALAPIVSQNYTDFAMVRPDPAKTWAQVSKLDPSQLPPCQLFNPRGLSAAAARRAPSWGDIGKKR